VNRNELIEVISECCNDVLFVYNGKQSGVTSEVHNYVPEFQAWHGADVKTYSNIDDLMSDKFYSGKSINDLVGTIEIVYA
jgi:hypothetical protein